MKKNIYLIGFMGSGKTTLGMGLAEDLHYRFVDLDKEIEKKHGQSVPELFEKYGETQFRVWETEMLKEICTMSGCVVATGGGAPCFFNNMDLMNLSGITIYLRVSVDELFRRLSGIQLHRPLLRGRVGDDLKKFIAEQLSNRETFYLQALHIVQSDHAYSGQILALLQI